MIGCFVSVLTAQYLAWTPVGLDVILGVQGRYFVAPVLFVVILCPSLMLPRAVRSTSVGFAAIVTVPVTCLLIIKRYYLA